MSRSSTDWAEETAQLLVRVYEIHEMVIAESGGIPGLREAGLLHAAVARPFATFAGKDLYSTDFEKAAALFHSLIKNHPFMDGTKRTAFASALYYLEQCGYSVPEVLPMDEVIEFCVSVAEENLRIAQGELLRPRSIARIAAWFRRLSRSNFARPGLPNPGQNRGFGNPLRAILDLLRLSGSDEGTKRR